MFKFDHFKTNQTYDPIVLQRHRRISFNSCAQLYAINDLSQEKNLLIILLYAYCRCWIYRCSTWIIPNFITLIFLERYASQPKRFNILQSACGRICLPTKSKASDSNIMILSFGLVHTFFKLYFPYDHPEALLLKCSEHLLLIFVSRLVIDIWPPHCDCSETIHSEWSGSPEYLF